MKYTQNNYAIIYLIVFTSTCIQTLNVSAYRNGSIIRKSACKTSLLCEENEFERRVVIPPKMKNRNNVGRRNFIYGITGIMSANKISALLNDEKDPFIAKAVPSNNDGPMSMQSGNKPYAPNEALLPAVRVKLSIDDAIKLVEEQISPPSSTLSSSLDTKTPNKKTLEREYISKLDKLLLQPQNYIQSSLQLQGIPNQPAKQYLESYKPMNGDLPFQLYLIKNGDVNTWKDLKKKEKEQEKNNEIRAAFNAYTDVLSFSGNSYLLNVDSKTKSNMIREDKLPELKQVVTSDMGMRYLYRNEILNAMDEVKAELVYQISIMEGGESTIDLSELLQLLKQAQGACNKWFSLIGDTDVNLAIATVLDERGP